MRLLGGAFWRGQAQFRQIARYDAECEFALLQVLLRRQDPTGDVATRNQVVLRARQHDVDTLRPQATPLGRVHDGVRAACAGFCALTERLWQSTQQGGRNRGSGRARQPDLPDWKARRFVFWQRRIAMASGRLRLFFLQSLRGLALPLFLFFLQALLLLHLALQRSPWLQLRIQPARYNRLCPCRTARHKQACCQGASPLCLRKSFHGFDSFYRLL